MTDYLEKLYYKQKRAFDAAQRRYENMLPEYYEYDDEETEDEKVDRAYDNYLDSLDTDWM